MSMTGGFLGGAQDRLLPASIPFRFFLIASVFHVLMWVTLFFGADQLVRYTGGAGLVLAAIHLATLGVFTMVAIGASYQLLPVVTRRPLAHTWPARLSFWLMTAGICLLTYGMATAASFPMQSGAVLVVTGLAVFIILTADNLRQAGSMPVVSAHGWGALVALIIFAALGLILVWDFDAAFLENRNGIAILHMVLAVFGFMGLLIGGLCLILIPMFVLSQSLPNRPGWFQLGLAVVALIGYMAAYVYQSQTLAWLSIAAGLGASAVYIWQMRKVQKSSMRKRLGLSFVLIRTSWAFLVLGLMLGGLVMSGIELAFAPPLFGFFLLAGWLLTFLTGILQRIMPFLASMHASGSSGLPVMVSELTAELPLKIHAYCHFSALLLVSVGIVINVAVLVLTGAFLGAIGAIAFVVFAMNVWIKLRENQVNG
ncbi:MAG: hypothetical protein KAS85_10260 [Rhodobacteraceae bacterium]|nr:hypothetical protein [Paracoccaceae bacterium]